VRRNAALGLSGLILASGASAETLLSTERYSCDGGVTFWVVNVFAEDQLVGAVISADDRLWQLAPERSASGVRLSVGEADGFVWWMKGDDAMLMRRTNGAEDIVMTCVNSQ
jgi:membrane-bound inhibitor of C-type lysozyme